MFRTFLVQTVLSMLYFSFGQAGNLAGVVRDSLSGIPLPDVTVEAAGGVSTITGTDGAFSLSATTGIRDAAAQNNGPRFTWDQDRRAVRCDAADGFGVALHDLQGRLRCAVHLRGAWTLPDLPDGLYLAVLTAAGRTETRKLAATGGRMQNRPKAMVKAAASTELTFSRPGHRPKTVTVTEGTAAEVRLGLVKPDSTNTGVRDASVLKKVTTVMTVNTPGAVIENLDMVLSVTRETKGLVINANNVTVRNCRFYDAQIKVMGGNFLIEDVDVSGPHLGVGIISYDADGGGIIRRTRIHHVSSDAFRPGDNQLIEGCTVDHIGMGPTSHPDVIQIISAAANVTIRWNNFDVPSPAKVPALAGFKSGRITIFGAATSKWVVEYNWLNGGDITVTGQDDIVYRYNRFGRDYQFGLRTANGITWSAANWYGNVWDDTGMTAP